LLKQRHKDFFLFKHQQLFADFVSFLEIETLSGAYLTIRQSVSENMRIAIKHHPEPLRTLTDFPGVDWDHWDLQIDRARQFLDGLLDLRAIRPWDYRMPVIYALRIQKDFNDVFQLDKFRGWHLYWKPYIAQLLGFDARLVTSSFELTKQVDELKQTISAVQTELLDVETDFDTIEGLLTLRSQEEDTLAARIREFDFRLADSEANEELVDELDGQTANLNQQTTYLAANRTKIMRSLEKQTIIFDPEDAAHLFEEAGQTFPIQIRKTFDDLIRFNRAITQERKGYLTVD